MASSGWNAFSTTCVPLNAASCLLLVTGNFKRFGCIRFTMHCWTEEIMRPLEVSWCLRRCAMVMFSNVNIRIFDCICWSKGTEYLKSELWMVSMPLRSQKTNDLFFFFASVSARKSVFWSLPSSLSIFLVSLQCFMFRKILFSPPELSVYNPGHREKHQDIRSHAAGKLTRWKTLLAPKHKHANLSRFHGPWEAPLTLESALCSSVNVNPTLTLKILLFQDNSSNNNTDNDNSCYQALTFSQSFPSVGGLANSFKCPCSFL